MTGDGIVGRRRELEWLRAWLDDARHGRRRLVLCVGEPGIGKTRLAQELAGIALAGDIAVAWGRCGEAEGAPAFWAVAAGAALVGSRARHRVRGRHVGTVDGKLRVVSLWESKAHADRFFAETLPPILTEVLGPEPVGAAETIGIDVARSYTREPVA